MQTYQLKRKNPNTKKIKVGRGGKRGKTSGRGHKGQKSRAGRKLRPEIRDMIKKIPKKRGHGKNRSNSYNASNTKPIGINLSVLDEAYESGDHVTPRSLISHGVVSKIKGKNPKIKILGGGELKKKINIEGLSFSNSAKEKILKAGGNIK